MEASCLSSYIHRRGSYLSLTTEAKPSSEPHWQPPHRHGLRIPWKQWFQFSSIAAISKTLILVSSHLILILLVLRPPFVCQGRYLDKGLMILPISPSGRKHQRSTSSTVMIFLKQIWQNFWRWWHFPWKIVLCNRHLHCSSDFYPWDTVILVFS